MARLSNDRLLRLRLRTNAWPDQHTTHHFQSGREAFLALLRSLPQDTGRIVLLPTYAPEGLYAPVVAAGWRVEMYPIGPDLSPDWDELAGLLERLKPTVAVLIHHFGVPQDARHFSSLCKQFGALCVEDLAHVAAQPESAMGSAADVVLTSLPKIFGIPDGAELSFSTSLASTVSLRYDTYRASLHYLLLQTGVLILATLASRLPSGTANLVGRVSARLLRPYPVLMAGFMTVRPMSFLSRFLLAHTDRREEVDRRIELAGLYAAHLDRTAFAHLLSSVPVAHGLFGYPVMVDDRPSLVAHLASHDTFGTILTSRWDFRREAGYIFEDGSTRILSQHFLFPLSGSLSNADVMCVINVANSWARLSTR